MDLTRAEEDIELEERPDAIKQGGAKDPLALSVGVGVGAGSLFVITGGIAWFVWARRRGRVSFEDSAAERLLWKEVCFEGYGGAHQRGITIV
eukprot:1157330-Pelagomonas_calceolata.AAC.4